VAIVRDQKLSLPGMAPGQTAIQQVVPCAQLNGVPALGRCVPGAQAASIMIDFGSEVGNGGPMSEHVWRQPPGVQLGHLRGLPVDSVVVGTDGSSTAVELARTVLDATYPDTYSALTIGEIQSNDNRLLDDYRRLAEIVILASLPIAACSLAVSIAGGLLERKRPFSLLRLTGARLAMLRRVIGLEAAAPMLITAVASVGAGLLAAYLFLRAQLHERLQAPGPGLYLVIAAGLVVSLAVIASTLPMLKRLTGPEVARND
jgi:predicted lysophospholipase L1 biosynthesis ABC-type transport system permease subunit